MGNILIALNRIITYVFLILGILSLLVAFILAIVFFLFDYGPPIPYHIRDADGYTVPFFIATAGCIMLFGGLIQWRRGRRLNWW